MKAGISILFLLMIVSSLAIAQSDAEKLIGRWANTDPNEPMELIFKENGSAVIDGDHVRWKVKSGVLFVIMEGETETYNYLFNSVGIKFSGGDLEKPMTFKRIVDTKNKEAITKEKRNN